MDCGSQATLKSKFQFSPSTTHANFQSARVFRGPEKGGLRSAPPPMVVLVLRVPFRRRQLFCHLNAMQIVLGRRTTAKSILNTFRVSKVRLRSFVGCEFFRRVCAVDVESFGSLLSLFLFLYNFIHMNVLIR